MAVTIDGSQGLDTNNTELTLEVGGSEKARINSSGQLMVGNTSNETYVHHQLSGGCVLIKDVTSAGGEATDWPIPSLAIKNYDDITANTMLMFALRDDTLYDTSNTKWNFRLTHGSGATTTSSSTHLEFNGPGNLYFKSSRGIGPYTVFAWASWSDLGTINVNGSHNVSSISEGTQSWFMYFANNAPSANFAAVASLESGATNTAFEVGAKATDGVRMWQSVGGGSDNTINAASVIVVGSGY